MSSSAISEVAKAGGAEDATNVDGVATETGAALDAVGPLVETAASVEESELTYEASASGSEVSLPKHTGDPLVLDTITTRVEVGLPEVGVGEGVLDESGAVVYEAETAPVSLAAQATATGGVQILVVIGDASAPQEYDFDISPPAGGFLALDDNGAVNVVGADGITVAQVEPAWARDASGNSVPTWFELDGDRVVQHVSHEGFLYPVVADPNIGNCGWNSCTIYFTTEETRRIAEGTIGATAIAAWCGVAAGPYGAAACITMGAYFVLSAQSARSQRKCLKVKVYYAVWVPVTGSYTQGTCST